MKTKTEKTTVDSGWEHFPHGADIGVRGYGRSLDEAFANAALALTAVITDPADVQPRIDVPIHVESPDLDLLFFDWINELIYAMAHRNMLFGRFRVHVAGLSLSAVAQGELVDRDRHQPAVEIKGASFTELKVKQLDGCWVAQCVVDV